MIEHFEHILHGTSTLFLDEIWKRGLVPRGHRPSNYQGKWESMADRIYLVDGAGQEGLSTAWMAAYTAVKRNGGAPIALEVQLDAGDEDRFLPDEDAVQKLGGREGMIRQVRVHLPEVGDQIRHYPDWLLSLIAYDSFAVQGTIPPGKIRTVYPLRMDGPPRMDLDMTFPLEPLP